MAVFGVLLGWVGSQFKWKKHDRIKAQIWLQPPAVRAHAEENGSRVSTLAAFLVGCGRRRAHDHGEVSRDRPPRSPGVATGIDES